MKIPVEYGKGVRRECEVFHALIFVDGRPKEIYRSRIHTNPVTKKRCYVEFDPESAEIKVVEVK